MIQSYLYRWCVNSVHIHCIVRLSWINFFATNRFYITQFRSNSTIGSELNDRSIFARQNNNFVFLLLTLDENKTKGEKIDFDIRIVCKLNVILSFLSWVFSHMGSDLMRENFIYWVKNNQFYTWLLRFENFSWLHPKKIKTLDWLKEQPEQFSLNRKIWRKVNLTATVHQWRMLFIDRVWFKFEIWVQVPDKKREKYVYYNKKINDHWPMKPCHFSCISIVCLCCCCCCRCFFGATEWIAKQYWK